MCIGEFADSAAQPLQRVGLDRQAYIDRARASRWKTIATNATLIDGNKPGHLPA